MKYSRVCHDCGFKSEREMEFCPECGTAKKERYLDSTLYSSVIKYFSKKIPNIDNAEMLVSLFINLLLLLIGILFVNPIVESSELLWIFFFLYFIQGIFKNISFQVERFNKLHLITRGLIFFYTGAGIGNLVSYAGRSHNYYVSEFFYPDMLIKEFISGNGLIIIGGLSGVIIMMIIRNVLKFLK